MSLVMLVGLPGSGKTHFRDELAKRLEMHHRPKLQVWCPDDLLAKCSEKYAWTPKAAAEAWARAYRSFGRCLLDLEMHLDIGCWDAVFHTNVSRSAIANIARGLGHHTYAVYLKTDPEVCFTRNASRPVERQVPRETMASMQAHLHAPSVTEGFAGVHVVDSPATYEEALQRFA
jgi:tRNA uridine 5-carbamoylmethylation protein Kti12